jgi:hypothetical protein
MKGGVIIILLLLFCNAAMGTRKTHIAEDVDTACAWAENQVEYWRKHGPVTCHELGGKQRICTKYQNIVIDSSRVSQEDRLKICYCVGEIQNVRHLSVYNKRETSGFGPTSCFSARGDKVLLIFGLD